MKFRKACHIVGILLTEVLTLVTGMFIKDEYSRGTVWNYLTLVTVFLIILNLNSAIIYIIVYDDDGYYSHYEDQREVLIALHIGVWIITAIMSLIVYGKRLYNDYSPIYILPLIIVHFVYLATSLLLLYAIFCLVDKFLLQPLRLHYQSYKTRIALHTSNIVQKTEQLAVTMQRLNSEYEINQKNNQELQSQLAILESKNEETLQKLENEKGLSQQLEEAVDGKKDVIIIKEKCKNLCSICMVLEADIVIVPCGHRVCGNCKDEISKCHICRNPLEKFVRTYDMV